jgi:hypothetical protein
MESNQKISVDLQYQTLYKEMRRYRNTISAIGCWYSTLLIALIFIFGLLTNEFTLWGKWLLPFLIVITSIGIIYLLWFDHMRYVELRNLIKSSKIEPLDRWETRKSLTLKPHLVFTIIIALLTIFLSMEILKR